MHIVFRVDASVNIGTGHVMRCLTLAHALKQKQHKITFICRNLTGNLIGTIEENKFDVIPLTRQKTTAIDPTNHHAEWLEVSWRQDANETIDALNKITPVDWLVVDHYSLDFSWEDTIKPYVSNILVIDDLADRKHTAKLLLDQNYYMDMEHRYKNLVDVNTELLIGPKYTLLREEFIKNHSNLKQRNNHLQNIFIYFGGVDSENLTLRSLQALRHLKSKADINVIIGNTNPHKKIIFDYCKTIKNAHCYSDVDDISTFMQKADLAIGAGGTTTWERCYLGLPAIVITLALNQAAVNEAVAKKGACILAGDTSITETDIAKHLEQITDNPDTIPKMSDAALSIMEEHIGAQGIAEIMENSNG